MPTLDWIGKKAVLNHHREVPYHLLECDSQLSVGDAGSGNLLVQGDNLLALKALLPYYAAKVKCVYIDPPYNTGNEGWAYNDAVNSPEINAWLGKVVGGELEDLSRHDKWLCMMYPRLRLLRDFLREDGAIFVSLDDNEISALRNLLDEIFGKPNFIATVVWQKRTSPDARLNLGPAHDYIVVYAKNIDALKPTLNKIPVSPERESQYKNPDEDPRGAWASVDITGQTGHATAEQFYEITLPSGRKISPSQGRCWAMAEATFKNLVADGRIWFGQDGDSRPRLKKFLNESDGVTTWTWWPNAEVGHNQEATKELKDIMGRADSFENPKPTRLLERIIRLAGDDHSLVLDSFAGTGTTGHSVLKLNHSSGSKRRFILVEIDPRIAEEITSVRLRRAVEGFDEIGALGGGFRFCRLGKPIFSTTGSLQDVVSFAELARHVFFTETGEPLPSETKKSPLIGVLNNTAYFLLYNGVLGDKSLSGGNVLTGSLLARLPRHDGRKIIEARASHL
jgi:adenine-specific DNA-methyltransferase